MFKILNLILVSALILIVSIACSTTTDDSVSDVEFYTHEQQYNKLLAYTTELEERLSNLEAVVSNDIYILDLEMAKVIERYEKARGNWRWGSAYLNTTIGIHCYDVVTQEKPMSVWGRYRSFNAYSDFKKDYPEGCMP
tara:strand:- start:235 stop:648 length:414 start_codon:yes stop_codon:yes gene_type:complete